MSKYKDCNVSLGPLRRAFNSMRYSSVCLLDPNLFWSSVRSSGTSLYFPPSQRMLPVFEGRLLRKWNNLSDSVLLKYVAKFSNRAKKFSKCSLSLSNGASVAVGLACVTPSTVWVGVLVTISGGLGGGCNVAESSNDDDNLSLLGVVSRLVNFSTAAIASASRISLLDLSRSRESEALAPGVPNPCPLWVGVVASKGCLSNALTTAKSICCCMSSRLDLMLSFGGRSCACR